MYEDSLNTYFNIMSDSQNDNERMETNNKILRIFREILNEEETINYPFDSLNYVGILKSDNNKLKIYNWNLPFNDGTNKYFGFIQYYSKKEKKHYLYELFDKSEKIQNPEFLRLSNKNWYGALYYSILENKYHGNIYYTLLATDFNDMFTNKKIVEILSFDEENQVIFGAPVFKNRKNTLYRIIFEYSARSSMGLHFDNKKGMIVYDHLSPIRPSLKGQFEFYAPDLSFDGLKFEKGIWNSYSDLDVRNLDIK
ncbi:MAG: hypothetical protein PF487_01065 [Bacteroidales bacterium]|nr:hypothetical protein [Bacteroidales bacterium]